MHSDHCAKKLLPWFDGMLAADEAGDSHERGSAGYEKPLEASRIMQMAICSLYNYIPV